MNTSDDAGTGQLSIILPVLNEADLIIEQLQSLQDYRRAGHEVLVVDGGSNDATAELAASLADRVLRSAAGRSLQMNAGAAAAHGDVLLFLHADTRLPTGAVRLITNALARDPIGWGWFPVQLDNPAWPYRIIERCMNLRTRLTFVCTGDQALFVRRALFERIGGFPPIPLMEDVAISKLLRRKSSPGWIPRPVRAASRRWESQGIVRTIVLMWWLRLQYFLGVSPERLVRRYYPGRE